MKYFPSIEKISQETIATLIAIILSAYLISKSPTLKNLINSTKI